MNLHEYQAKELLKKYNVPVQNGTACTSIEEAVNAYNEISTRTNCKFVVVKAQIHAGGRGKGTFIEVPEQHGDAGKVVSKLFMAEDAYYDGPQPQKEFYLSILLDRQTKKYVFMYSTEGGMNIEDVAHDTPEKIFKEWIQPGSPLMPFQARKIAFNLGNS